MAKTRNVTTNKNSRIETRVDNTGKVRTETSRRDPGQLDVAITTDTRTNSTRVFVDVFGRDGNFGYPDLELDGRQARTLYLALQRHFSLTGKTVY